MQQGKKTMCVVHFNDRLTSFPNSFQHCITSKARLPCKLLYWSPLFIVYHHDFCAGLSRTIIHAIYTYHHRVHGLKYRNHARTLSVIFVPLYTPPTFPLEIMPRLHTLLLCCQSFSGLLCSQQANDPFLAYPHLIQHTLFCTYIIPLLYVVYTLYLMYQLLHTPSYTSVVIQTVLMREIARYTRGYALNLL